MRAKRDLDARHIIEGFVLKGIRAPVNHRQSRRTHYRVGVRQISNMT